MRLFLVFGFLSVIGGLGSEKFADPFASPPTKTAAELSECVNGHKTLREVEVVYGLISSEDPKYAPRLSRGEIILGGSVGGGREHWVLCETCGLRFDDEYSAWMDGRWATIADVQLIRSDKLQGLPLGIAGSRVDKMWYVRWYHADGLVGEQLSITTKTQAPEIVAALKAWVPASIEIYVPEENPNGEIEGRWEWKESGSNFMLSWFVIEGDEFENYLTLDWHREMADSTELLNE